MKRESRLKRRFESVTIVAAKYPINQADQMDKKVMSDYRKILEALQGGEISVEEALLQIKKSPFTDLGFAKADQHREVLQANKEVIYGAGKSAGQICAILSALTKGEDRLDRPVLITRLSGEKADEISRTHPVTYYKEAKLALYGRMPEPDGIGNIAVVSGGTSDLPVAEEAALTAQALGNEVVRIYDVGVSGLYRLLAHMDEIMTARCVIAVAGMEGALASVVGGLAQCPVIAVPTSVGYGASFGGISALLSMLNSCASGVSVVNIDNGFGAGYQASLINHVS